LVSGLRLDRVQRMARTLAWSTARDVRYDLDREARHRPAAAASNDDAVHDAGESARSDDRGDDDADRDRACDDHEDRDRDRACDDDGGGAAAGHVAITARPVSRRRPVPSSAGPDGPLLFRTLCDQLTELGGDIELIVNVKVRGLTYEEAGEFRGCTEEAARKRVDRVLRLLRKRLEREVEGRAPRPLRKDRSN
jgi:hypothetical protein